MPSKQSRRWCYTVFTEEDLEYMDSMSFKCSERETCPETKKQHWQGYVEFKKKISLGGLKKVDATAHWEAAKGSAQDNMAYCAKENNGTYSEFGKTMQQGDRTDINVLRDTVLAGKSANDIAEETPQAFHQYGRLIERLETIAMNKRNRTEPTMIVWIWGKTGTGKSYSLSERIAALGRSIDKAYWHPVEDKGWWDNYNQQDDVIFDDFRGEIPFQTLLRLADRYQTQVSRRAKAPLSFISKTIWITSSKNPQGIYGNVCDDQNRLEQLLRRCKEIIHLENPFSDIGESVYNVVEHVSADAE